MAHQESISKDGWLTLHSGRRAKLTSLRQTWTYEGLLEGAPNVELNKRLRERCLADAEAQARPWLGKAIMIQPPEKPIVLRYEYDAGVPSAMPAVECIADFESWSPARDVSRDGSALLVIWYQEELALPIDPGVLDVIRALEWEALATDFNC